MIRLRKPCGNESDWLVQVLARNNKVQLGKIVNYASRQLRQIPIELTQSPAVEQLHIGFNELNELPRKFFRMSFLSVLNLDQNMLFEITKDFQHLSGLAILSLKVEEIFVTTVDITFDTNDFRLCRTTGLNPYILISAIYPISLS